MLARHGPLVVVFLIGLALAISGAPQRAREAPPLPRADVPMDSRELSAARPMPRLVGVSRLVDSGVAGSDGHEPARPLPRQGEPVLLALSIEVEESALLSWREVYAVALAASGHHAFAVEAAYVAHGPSGKCPTGESGETNRLTGEYGANPAVLGDYDEDTGQWMAKGAWQVWARWHGPVPDDVHGQAVQVFDIWDDTEDWRLWSCRP